MNFIKKWIKSINSKFFNKFWLGIVGIILIGYILTGVMFYNELNESANKKIEEFVISSYRQVENSLSLFVNRYELITKNIYSTQQINRFLNSNFLTKMNYDIFVMVKEISSILRNVQTNSTEIDDIYVLALNQELVISGTTIKRDINYLGNELIEMVKEQNGENVWLSYKDQLTGGTKLLLLKYLNIGRPGGILVIEFDESSLNNMVMTDGDSNNSIYILDKSGIIISSNNKGRIGQNLEPELLAAMKKSDKLFEKVMIDELYKFVYKGKMKDTFDIVILYDTDMLERDNRVIIAKQILLLAGILTITLLFVIVFSRIFAIRVVGLVDKIIEIQKGNLNITETVNSNDEFQYMDKSLCKMANNIKKLNREIIDNVNEKKELELKYLQMQIKPHFLYNSLSSIRWLSMQRNQLEISNLLEHLIQYYKITLSKGNDIIPIKDEIELTKSYVAMLNLIHKDQILLDVYVSESLKNVKISKLFLQPFVENSIQHGKAQDESLSISISVEKMNECIKITIEDDGKGISNEVVDEIHGYFKHDKSRYKSFGIVSTIDRLKMLYQDVELSITRKEEGGTVVDLLILM